MTLLDGIELMQCACAIWPLPHPCPSLSLLLWLPKKLKDDRMKDQARRMGGCRQCTGQGPIALGAHEYTHVYYMYSVLASYPR